MSRIVNFILQIASNIGKIIIEFISNNCRVSLLSSLQFVRRMAEICCYY